MLAPVLDHFAERLARHVDAGEQFVSRGRPGRCTPPSSRRHRCSRMRELRRRRARPAPRRRRTARRASTCRGTSRASPSSEPRQRQRARKQEWLCEKISSSRTSSIAISPPSRSIALRACGRRGSDFAKLLSPPLDSWSLLQCSLLNAHLSPQAGRGDLASSRRRRHRLAQAEPLPSAAAPRRAGAGIRQCS